MQNKLYIGNLPFSTTEEELRAAFSEFGKVTDVRLPRDRETGRFRGFGFVTMASEAEAQAALAMNGKDFGGRPLKVNFANTDRVNS